MKFSFNIFHSIYFYFYFCFSVTQVTANPWVTRKYCK